MEQIKYPSEVKADAIRRTLTLSPVEVLALRDEKFREYLEKNMTDMVSRKIIKDIGKAD